MEWGQSEERQPVRPTANESFDDGFQSAEFSEFSEFSAIEFSTELAFSQPELYEPNDTDNFASPFAEIEQIFAAQNLQETLALQIIKTANEQSLQNRQIEISREVQDTMFARLLEMSAAAAVNNDTSGQDAAVPPSFGDNSVLNAVYQTSLTDNRSLEQFTQSVEDDHRRAAEAAKEAERRLSLQTLHWDDDSSAELVQRGIESQEYENEFEHERQSGMTMSL